MDHLYVGQQCSNNEFLKPLSQLAHDHFTTLCDRNILASHDLSHTLHDHSHSLHLF